MTFAAQMKYGLPIARNGSELVVVGIDPVNPDIVYAKWRDGNTETFYISRDAAVTWTPILEQHEPAAFVVRKTGELVVSTKLSGSKRSLDHGGTWTDLAMPPHIGCLAEDAAGRVWACTQNYEQVANPANGIPHIPADGFGIMMSQDLVTWHGVLRFQDIADAVSCPAGTAQHDQCVEKDDGMPSVWCCLAMQLGISSPGADCSGRLACVAPPMEAPPSRDVIRIPPPAAGGCCDSGAGASLWQVLPVVFVLRRRRR